MKQQTEQPATLRNILRRWVRIWRVFAPFSRRHRRPFWYSAWFAVLVVSCRLALPWPLRSFLAPILKATGEQASLPEAAASDSLMQPILWSAAFLLLAFGLGWFELRQRLWVARFSIGWVRDIRAEAFRAARDLDPRHHQVSTGDLVSRLIGDTARLKAGLQGFMTHIATNGLLYLGVTVILGLHSILFGVIFLLVGVLLLLVAMFGATKVYLRSRRFRRKEGKLAARIEDALQSGADEDEFAKVNYSSGVHEASVVKLQGRTTLAAHIIVAGVMLTAFWIGQARVQSGELKSDDLLLFLLYGLTIHHPSVRIARQGTRIGKMMACGDRLERLLREARWSRSVPAVEPLRQEILLRSLTLKSGAADSRRRRLRKVSTAIRQGERIALLGGSGSGKSTLMNMLAGQVAPSRGNISWDGRSYRSISSLALRDRITYVRERPSWTSRSLESLLPAATPEEAAARDQVVSLCKVKQTIARLPNGYQSELASSELSPHETRGLALAAALLRPNQVVLLDDPFESLSLARTRKILDYLAALEDSTIVVAMTRPKCIECFDRILALEAGSLVFDGTPAEWQARQSGALEP